MVKHLYNRIKQNTGKMRVITFMYMPIYKLCYFFVTWADSMKDVGVLTDSKLYFWHVDYISFSDLWVILPRSNHNVFFLYPRLIVIFCFGVVWCVIMLPLCFYVKWIALAILTIYSGRSYFLKSFFTLTSIPDLLFLIPVSVLSFICYWMNFFYVFLVLFCNWPQHLSNEQFIS